MQDLRTPMQSPTNEDKKVTFVQTTLVRSLILHLRGLVCVQPAGCCNRVCSISKTDGRAREEQSCLHADHFAVVWPP
jgi:hypothetical protein